MFKTRKLWISWPDIAVDIARYKVNFFPARNWSEGSILPVVPFRFDQFKSDRTLLAHRFVSSRSHQTLSECRDYLPWQHLSLYLQFAFCWSHHQLSVVLLQCPQLFRLGYHPKDSFFCYFFKEKIITPGLSFVLPIIHWSSNKRKFRILYGKFLMADDFQTSVHDFQLPF